MAKSKKSKKLTIEEALEQLLGRKATKRIRQLAERIATDEENQEKKGKKARNKR